MTRLGVTTAAIALAAGYTTDNAALIILGFLAALLTAYGNLDRWFPEPAEELPPHSIADDGWPGRRAA